MDHLRLGEARRAARIQRLAEMRALEQRNIPARWKVPAPASAMYLTIVGGQTLSDAITLGIKYYDSGIDGYLTTVPSLYDPNITSTFIDGIGRATLTIDDTVQSGYVLVVNDGRNASAIRTALAATWRVMTLGTITLPLASDATQSVTLYVPYFK